MRGVGSDAPMSARDEERIGPLDDEPLRPRERRASMAGPRALMHGRLSGRPALNVLRTVAEDFLDADVDAVGAPAGNSAVQTKPPAPFRIEHENADRCIAVHTAAEGIRVG
jgi:hypothetical protein